MKTLIAVPCMDTLDVEFVRSLEGLNRVGTTCVTFLANSLVYVSREKLAQAAIENECDYILWLDSDMTFGADLLEKMMEDIKDADIVTGLCFRRRPPYTPCIWEHIRLGLEGNDIVEYNDYPDGVFEVDACGMAACLCKVDILKKCFEAEGACFQPYPNFGEDLTFCLRAKKQGAKIVCDSAIKVGHVSRMLVTEDTYRVYRRNTDACEN